MKPQLRFDVHPYRVWIHRIQTTPRHFEEFNEYRFLSNLALAQKCVEQNKCGQIEHFSLTKLPDGQIIEKWESVQ